jgi:thiamine-monophosphate kinase
MGEFDLLARVRERLPGSGGRIRVGIGDDAAVTTPGGATATSVDAVIEGIHFRREHATLAQIGHKALAAALSDLAAMGAEAGEAYLVLFVPPDLSEEDCLELLEGAARLAAANGVRLAGGDVSRAPLLAVTVTVVGHAKSPDDFVRRDGASPGDALAVTGELGGAAAGLTGLEQPERTRGVAAGDLELLRRRQIEPQAQLEAGRVLAAAGATAMIDLSDGLAGDAHHLAERSGVGLRIDATELPIAAGVVEVAGGEREGLELAVGGGEDYELLAALPVERFDEAKAAVEAAGHRLTRIGDVVPEKGVAIRLPDGARLTAKGFDQLD